MTFICQVNHVRDEDLNCDGFESGGYRCERTDEHGVGQHTVYTHTVWHSTYGSGWSCGSIERMRKAQGV